MSAFADGGVENYNSAVDELIETGRQRATLRRAAHGAISSTPTSVSISTAFAAGSGPVGRLVSVSCPSAPKNRSEG